MGYLEMEKCTFCTAKLTPEFIKDVGMMDFLCEPDRMEDNPILVCFDCLLYLVQKEYRMRFKTQSGGHKG
jgi:hypothetical protein